MASRQIKVNLVYDTFSFTRELRKAMRSAKEMAWALRFKAPSDDERLAFAWAVDHVRRGRRDLAVEDLNWLGTRL